MEVRELFGGALSASIPAAFLDLSCARPVPDNQEVFSEGGSGGAVLIVEVVEFQAAVDAGDIARYLWEDLAECNGAVSSRWRELSFEMGGGGGGGGVTAIPSSRWLGRCNAVRGGVGFHEVSGRGEAPSLLTCVALGVLRLPGEASEVVASAAVPVEGPEAEAAAGAAAARAEALLNALLPSIRVNDWALFGGGEEAGEGGGAAEGQIEGRAETG